MNTAKNIVTRYDHEHDVLVISNPFYEQLTKSVRRELELNIIEKNFYMYMVTYTCFMHCKKLCACAQKHA